uniref:Uncharacterized protein n=1 Tax=Micrurus corallinus TaxID=54390 RepID=A0A2D4EXN4_MICCO
MFTSWMPFLSPVQSLVQQIYSHCAERERNICLYLGLNTQTSDCEVRPPPLGYHITLGESSLFLEDRVICLLGQCVHTDPPLSQLVSDWRSQREKLGSWKDFVVPFSQLH